MNYLFVVAHPDDEVLGAGATIEKLIKEGHSVALCILSNNAAARANLSDTLLDDEQKAFSIIGITNYYLGDFPNIKMNTVPHLELVQFIEKCIESFKAEIIVTHHPSDINNDHMLTSYATQAASRLFQRRPGIPFLKQLLYMEIPSSTDWSFDPTNRFVPNYYIEIGKRGVDLKIEALSAYNGVMRSYPHPRSKMAIKALAAFRGAQAGCDYAEAFECVFRRD